MTDNRNMTGKELSNAMNDYFIAVETYPLSQTESGNWVRSTRAVFANSIMLTPTTPNEVETMISNWKNNIAAGINEMKVLPLKLVSKIISHDPI